MKRDFCKPIKLTKAQKKELTNIPRLTLEYNCQGDCLVYENGYVVEIQINN